MQRILVTGGGGFIGQAIVNALLQKNKTVGIVARNAYPDLEKLGVICHQGDIRDLNFLKTNFSGYDTVFHVAAKAGIWGTSRDYYSINFDGTKNVISACRHNGISVLTYTSTPSVVFAGKDIKGGNESLPYATRPLCHYAASKIKAEQEILAANDTSLKTAAIRPHLVWGPGDRQLIPRLLDRGRKKQLKIVGDGTNKVDITYIDNVVTAHILAAENLHSNATAAGEAFFIGQREPVILWDWINTLFDQVGINKVTQKVPFSLAYYVGGLAEFVYLTLHKQKEPKMTRFLAHQLAQSHWFEHTKAEQILGYQESVSTEVGVQRLLSWLKEQQPTPHQQ